MNKYKASVRFKNGDKGMFDVTAESLDNAREVVLREVEEAASVVLLYCGEEEYV